MCAQRIPSADLPTDVVKVALRRNSDPVATEAADFAHKLDDVAGVAGAVPDDDDAAQVNANIALVAERADSLIAALIENAEDHGLEASGDWIETPLVETRRFEIPEVDPELQKADDDHDRKLNS